MGEANENMTKAMPEREPHCGVFIEMFFYQSAAHMPKIRQI